MCYAPITTKINKRFINAATLKNAPIKGLFEGPCGQCEQCKTQKVNEWSFRLLEEAKETFRLGGFSIFDTLTYDNLHVPTVGKVLYQLGEFSLDVTSSICDMLCNSKRDVQLFFKRLRSLYSGPIRYYLVSEYGNDERYTHRPHYHVQFFFPSPTITPEQASKLIRQAWQNGRTDGIEDKGQKYFFSKRCFTSFTPYIQNIILYITKYMHKDYDYYNRVVEPVIAYLHRSLDPNKTNKMSYSLKLRERKIKSHIGNFMLCSKGIGESYLTEKNRLFHVKQSHVRLRYPSGKYYGLPLPRYYVKKFYYIRDKDNTLLPTPLGEQRQQYLKQFQLESTITDIMAALGISHQDATPVAEYFLNNYNTLKINLFRSYKVTNNEQTRIESTPYVEYSGNSATLADFLQAYTTPIDENYKPLIINYLKHKHNEHIQKQRSCLVKRESQQRKKKQLCIFGNEERKDCQEITAMVGN